MNDTATRTRIIRAGESFTYEHPGERDGAPQEVANEAAKDLERAAAVFARHTEAAVRQVRSGYLSRELSRDPSLRPDELAKRWESSNSKRACIVLIRAAKAANTAVKKVREHQVHGG